MFLSKNNLFLYIQCRPSGKTEPKCRFALRQSSDSRGV